jgi:hypothetical protein
MRVSDRIVGHVGKRLERSSDPYAEPKVMCVTLKVGDEDGSAIDR